MAPRDPLDDPEALFAAFADQLAEESGEVPADRSAAAQPSPAVPLEVHADPRLLSLVERRLRPELVPHHSLRTWVGELPHHLDPADWGTGFIAIYEGGPPPDVREALREPTPQALLRDLYRPIHSEAPVALELRELPLDPGGRRAFAELTESRRREPVPRPMRSVEIVAAVQAERRAFLTTPWKAHLDDEAPRRDVVVAIEPSISW